jgi:predicted nucleic acid-binding protein
MTKIFIDTNILIYCLDKHDSEKQKKARELLKKVTLDLIGVISTQVLQEFYVAATRKLGVEPLQAKDMLHAFSNYETILVTPEIINNAIDCSVLNRISFRDSLIVSTAESALCETIWKEDLNDGQVIKGIKIENPLVLPAPPAPLNRVPFGCSSGIGGYHHIGVKSNVALISPV